MYEPVKPRVGKVGYRRGGGESHRGAARFALKNDEPGVDLMCVPKYLRPTVFDGLGAPSVGEILKLVVPSRELM